MQRIRVVLWSSYTLCTLAFVGPSCTGLLCKFCIRTKHLHIVYFPLLCTHVSGFKIFRHRIRNGDRTKWWRTKWYGKMVSIDKMVWTKWYNFIFCVHFNSAEFNIYLVTKSLK